MKTPVFAAVLGLAVLAAHTVFARTVEVAAYDASSGTVSLVFEASDEGSMLYAVGDTADRGTASAEAWKVAAYLGEVAGDTTAAEYALPAACLAYPCVIRFVLTPVRERPYDKAVDHLVMNYSATGATIVPAYIDTGLVPDATTVVEATFVQRTADTAAFGVSGKFYLFSNGNGSGKSATYWGFGDKSGSFTDFFTSIDTVYTLRLGPDGAYVNGVRQAGPFRGAAMSTSSTLTIGARRNDGAQTVAKQGFFRMYGAKVEQGGRTVRDYIPVVKNDVGYFFDRVNRTLVAPTGDGIFKISPAAQDMGSDFPTDATGWSGTLRLGRTVAVTSLDGITGAVTLELAGPAFSGRLFAVHDTEDKGADPLAWADCAYVDRLAGDVTTYATSLKPEWVSSAGVVRFVWVSDIESPFDKPMSAVTFKEKVSSYIDTGIVPNLETKVSAHVWLPGTTTDCAFGLSSVIYLFTAQGGDGFYYGFQSASGNKKMDKMWWGTWRTLTVGPDGAFVDNAEVAGPFTSAKYIKAYESMTLFGRRDNGSGDVAKNEGLRSIRRAQVWDGVRRVRDYVACMNGGKPYLYERVSGKYVTAKDLVSGNDIEPEIAGDEPLAVSEAVAIAGLTTARWDGGAADTRMTSAANWVGDTTPDLTGGTLVASFAAAGTEAQVDADVSLAGVAFDATTDFTIGTTGAHALGLGAAGIAMKAANNNLNITAPVTVAESQSWYGVGGKNGRINVKAPISGDAGRVLTVEQTTVALYDGSPDYKGTFAFGNGMTAKLFATDNLFGDSSVDTPVSIELVNGTAIDLFAVTVNRPLAVTAGLGGGMFCVHPSLDQTATKTRFAKPVSVSGGTTFWLDLGGQTTTFAGGLTVERDIELAYNGVLNIVDKPAALPATMLLGGSYQTVTFGVASNDVLKINMTGLRNTLAYTVDNAAYWSQRNGLDGAPYVDVSSNSVIDLKGTYQTFRSVTLPATAKVTGTAGAVCRTIVYGAAPHWRGLVTGAVSLSKGGPNDLYLDAANTSTGDLICNNGIVRISQTGSWAGTNVVLTADSRSQRLYLYHGNALANGAETTVALNGKAQVYVDAGVTQPVRFLTIDGHTAASGTWGSSSSAAEHKDDDHFAGTGVLDVKGSGFALFVR